jgi:transcriptional regulator with XRE-family HTH domain
MATVHPLTEFRLAQDPPWSRAKLAEALNVSRPAVFRWEKGDRKIDAELVPTISEITGIPARVLRPDLVELLGEAAQ